MHSDFARHDPEARRIGCGFVDAGDAKRPRASAARVDRQPHDAADGQALLGRELTRNQNVARRR